MANAYDLFVLGSGTAAMVASHRVAAAGWKVAVADYRPFGGTCALRGCDPKKVLVGAVQVIDDVRRMTGRGVVALDAHIDWRQLVEFKRSFTGPVPANQKKRYADKGIDTYYGPAQFTGRHTIKVGEQVFETRHVLLATRGECALLDALAFGVRTVVEHPEVLFHRSFQNRLSPDQRLYRGKADLDRLRIDTLL